jgi:hypothetical protein
VLRVVVRIGRAQWHGGHSATRMLYSSLLEVYVENINLRLGGVIRTKRRTVGWEGRGE